MNRLSYLQLVKENAEHFELAKPLWIEFNKEVNEHDGITETDEEIMTDLKRRINIQGNRPDMHFEIAFIGNTPVGISMFAIDTGTIYGLLPKGCRTIMGFYIIPEYRRKGYGTEFFEHIEEILNTQNSVMLYLTPDGITGKPFWKAVGFTDSGKIDPDNKMEIYIKEKALRKETISFSVTEFLTPVIAEKIAQAQWNKPEWSGSIINRVYEGKTETDCFNVIAKNECDEVVGRLFCLQNEENSKLWYYGDLFVVREYRRRHIAERMLKLAEHTLSDRWCDTLCCYVEPENSISQNLQIKAGFTERPYKSFNNLINHGQIMYEKSLTDFNVNTVSEDDARYVTMLYRKNVEAFHGEEIPYSEWCSLLSAEDTDERHFLIRKGAVPCGYLTVNGLESGDNIGWISMLAVEPAFHRKGIGCYAVSYAEDFLRDMGKTIIKIHTTSDNTPAQRLYKKSGYAISDVSEYITDDGIARKRYTFSKFF